MICRGDVEVTKKTEFGQSAKMCIQGTGESFGEMALLTNLPRSSTVTAKTDVRLSKISREDFEEIVSIDTAFSNMLERQAKDFADFDTLKTLQPFALIEPEKMLALIAKMQEKNYVTGDDIVTQGDKGNKYCIIKSGQAAVIKKEGDKDPGQIAVLKSGEGFGEEALIRDKPRNATVRALD
jgi:CRP-like cAMP-binding protein